MLENNNHKKSNCAFIEQQLVSSLYGEASVEEKNLFESHLVSCQACAEEFAGFEAVHSAVLEWRNLEFSLLETPAIEVSFEKRSEFYNSTPNLKVSRWRLAEFRKIFLFSPTLTASSAALALIVICIGIIFFTRQPSDKIEVAGKEVIKTNTVNLPLTPASDVASVKVTELPKLEAKTESRKLISESNLPRKISIAKAVTDSRIYAKNTNQDVAVHKIKPVTIEDKNSTFAKTVKLPRLNNIEEVEDKSLRLAELMEDDGAK